jgi:cytochrome P450
MRISTPAPGDRVSLAGIDLYEPENFRSTCQHPAWQTLRAEAPVFQQLAPNGTPFWSVTRHADCDKLLKDHRTFSSEDGTILASVGIGDTAGGQAMTVTDPPSHGQMRNPVLRKLGRAMIRQCAEQMEPEILQLVTPLLEDGKADFAHLMHRMPMSMLAPMMGVPEPLRDEIAYWSAASIAPEDPEFSDGAPPEAVSRRAHIELFDLFGEVIRYRRRNPGDDVMTALTTLLLDGEPLTDWHVALNCYSLVMGAHATTPHVAAQTLLVLIEQPHIRDAVERDPALVPALVDEGTRWTSPTHHLVRRASRDTEIGGVPIAEGDWMCGWVGSANRDESIWPDPYAFRLDRSPNPHLGFGAGAHYCIGSHVSRAALAMLFELLFRRVSRFELLDEPTHLLSNWINGMTHMTVSADLRK